jgi:hypothetical protein
MACTHLDADGLDNAYLIALVGPRVFREVVVCRDCHGYTRGNPWAFKRAQEEPKRISNEGDMVQILF